MTIIEQIKVEIERRFREYNKDSNHHLQAAEDAELLSFLDSLESEKPMNQEGLEEEITSYIEKHYHIRNDETLEMGNDALTTYDFAELARHFAQWGAERQKEQTEKRWLEDRDGCFWDGVEEGKKAMREQMMEEAVEGEVKHIATVHYVLTNEDQLTARLKQFQDGDKVRVIIVKED